MIFLTLGGYSQLCYATFYVVGTLWLLLSFAVVVWLRKGLQHLPVTRLLPVEYGTASAPRLKVAHAAATRL